MTPPCTGTCHVVNDFLTPLTPRLTENELKRLLDRWQQALPPVSQNATYRRAAFMLNRAARKYSTESLTAIGLPDVALQLMRAKDGPHTAQLALRAGEAIIEQTRSDNPELPRTIKRKGAAQVCIITGRTAKALETSPHQAANHTAHTLTQWAIVTGTGILHEIAFILEHVTEIQ